MHREDQGEVKFWSTAGAEGWDPGDECQIVPGDNEVLNPHRSQKAPCEPDVWLRSPRTVSSSSPSPMMGGLPGNGRGAWKWFAEEFSG